MRLLHTLALALMLTATLNGCAGLGKQDFACPGHPSKPLCLSTSEVYRLTDGYALPQTAPKPPRGNDTPRLEDALFPETPR